MTQSRPSASSPNARCTFEIDRCGSSIATTWSVPGSGPGLRPISPFPVTSTCSPVSKRSRTPVRAAPSGSRAGAGACAPARPGRDGVLPGCRSARQRAAGHLRRRCRAWPRSPVRAAGVPRPAVEGRPTSAPRPARRARVQVRAAQQRPGPDPRVRSPAVVPPRRGAARPSSTRPARSLPGRTPGGPPPRAGPPSPPPCRASRAARACGPHARPDDDPLPTPQTIAPRPITTLRTRMASETRRATGRAPTAPAVSRRALPTVAPVRASAIHWPTPTAIPRTSGRPGAGPRGRGPRRRPRLTRCRQPPARRGGRARTPPPACRRGRRPGCHGERRGADGRPTCGRAGLPTRSSRCSQVPSVSDIGVPRVMVPDRGADRALVHPTGAVRPRGPRARRRTRPARP